MTEIQLIPGDTRKPLAGHLNYSATADVPSPLFPMGPNTLGEQLYPVTVERTEERLRVGFSYVAPGMSVITDAYADRLEELPNRERELVEAALLRRAAMQAVTNRG